MNDFEIGITVVCFCNLILSAISLGLLIVQLNRECNMKIDQNDKEAVKQWHKERKELIERIRRLLAQDGINLYDYVGKYE